MNVLRSISNLIGRSEASAQAEETAHNVYIVVNGGNIDYSFSPIAE